MRINNQCTLKRLVGKIDNDFNISDSDWIPRVAAWTIDALSQMRVLPMIKRRRKLEVSDKIAIFPCDINPDDIKVFDSNGCEIPEHNNNSCGCKRTPQEIAVFDPTNTTGINMNKVGTIVYGNNNHNYVLDCNKIILNFDIDEIEVESKEVATYYDDYYDCDCPYIYDNGLLLEALAYYCLYKYLGRGNKHTIYNLNSNNPATNPFLQWSILKVKAANDVKKALTKDTNGWASFFYNSTFRPRS